MSNPEFPNSSASSSETQTTGEVIDQTPNVVKEERGEKAIGNYNRFSHLSKDELLAIEVADLSSEELPAYIAATKKIIAANENKQLATQEQEMMAVKEAENTAVNEEKPSEETEKTITAETTTAESNETTGTAEVAGSAEPIETTEEAEKTEPADEESAESIPNIPHISVEEVQEDIEQSKKQHRIRNFFSNISKKPVKAVVATLSAIGIIAAGAAIASTMNSHNANNDTPQDPKQDMSRTFEEEDALAMGLGAGAMLSDSDLDAMLGEIQGHHGIYDGYGEKGMFNSENKGTPYDFANAAEVAEVVGENPTEILIYTAGNQVESFADYLANMPAELQPEGCKGKSIIETEKWLESLTPEQYDAEFANFAKIMRSNTTTSELVTLSGAYHNAYMSKSGDGATTHENTNLVACTTQENGTSAIKFVFHDENGKEIGQMISKITVRASYEIDGQTYYFIEKDKGGCTQIVNPDGTMTYLYEDMTVIAPPDNTPTPEPGPGPEPTPEPEPTPTPTPTPEPEPTPTPTPTPEPEPTPTPTPEPESEPGWGKEGDPNSGPNRQPSDLVDPDSEVSEEENDATNQGNQGYVDDNQATPGSASENNGTNEDGFSKITADGADTEGGRLSGGEQQGGEGPNGTNPNAPTPEQTARDNAGNAAQEAAQDAGNTPGGDNNSNAAEEAAVAGGNF